MGLKEIDSKTGKPIPETRLQATYRKASQRSNERQKQAQKKFNKAKKVVEEYGKGSQRGIKASSIMKEAQKEFTQAGDDKIKDQKLTREYGADAPKAKGFGTYRKPRKGAKQKPRTIQEGWNQLFGIKERKHGGQVMTGDEYVTKAGRYQISKN
tara:strand:+ start:52 stop:513 length:462 start_codon:yes stop_codon:yes gene_type:complete